jgi:hypothetical protein
LFVEFQGLLSDPSKVSGCTLIARLRPPYLLISSDNNFQISGFFFNALHLSSPSSLPLGLAQKELDIVFELLDQLVDCYDAMFIHPIFNRVVWYIRYGGMPSQDQMLVVYIAVQLLKIILFFVNLALKPKFPVILLLHIL